MACDISTSLEALYHFTGNANDDSGNALNLTVTNATLTTDKNSVSNQAYDFNGTSAYMDGGNILHQSSAFSISLWCNADSFSAQSMLVTKTDAGGSEKEYFLGFPTSGKPWFFSYNNDGSAHFNIVAANSVPTGVWTHIVATYDGTNGRIYTNGVLDGTSANSSGTQLTTGLSSFLVGAYTATTQRFNGKIDEIRFYSCTLDQDSIDALYNGYDSPTCASTFIPYV